MAKKIINNWMFAAGSNPVFHQNFVKEVEEEENCEVEEVTALKPSGEEGACFLSACRPPGQWLC